MKVDLELIKKELEIVDKAIKDECKESNINEPNYISEVEWLIAFDVFEAHYLANNMIDKFPDFMYWFVRIATYYAPEFDEEHIIELFTKVCTSSGRLDNIDNKLRYEEGPAVCEEIKEKLAKLNKKTNHNNYDEVNLDPTSSQVKKRTLTRIEDNRFRRKKLK